MREAARAGDLSGQAYRLSTSTRRIAFVDNPAFGPRLTARPRLARAARRYFGRAIGDLLIRERDASAHDSLHAENMVHHPAHGVITHTDYADTVEGYRLGDALANLGEYGVFDAREAGVNLGDLLEGLRDSLAPRQLWSERADAFFASPRTFGELRNFLEDHYVSPLETRAALLNRRRHDGPLPKFNPDATSAEQRTWEKIVYAASPPLPAVDAFGDAWIEMLRRQGRVDAYQLEVQFANVRKGVSQAVRVIERGLLDSTLGARYFGDRAPTLAPVLARLRALDLDLEALIDREHANGWDRSLDAYVELTKDVLGRAADAHDALRVALGFDARNVATLQHMRIFGGNPRNAR